MPIDINYLQDDIGVEFNIWGAITGAEAIEANKNFLKLRYKIVDRTNCTEYLINNEEIQLIVNMEKEIAKVNPNLIIALISSSTLQYAMSRVWQQYVEVSDSGYKTAVIKDRKSAEKWIQEQLEKSNKNINKKN